MCGIAGWINYNQNLSQKKELLLDMTESLAHRGPDASGYWFSEHAALGHRRLSVVDLEGGKQPMIRNKGENTYVITYNGELYNTLDLRKELELLGCTFSTHSDTEVLLTAYMEWGINCVSKLNGIFAFGIWNQADQSLFLVRDRFGVKPLFYARREDSFLFGSEIKALLANPLVKAEIDLDGISEIFLIGPARTPGYGVFKGISELLPGQCILLNRNSTYKYKYWSLESRPHTDNLDITTETVRELFRDSVERQLVGDVPVCMFLSGGLDSSAITAVSSNYYKKNNLAPLTTYSIDYVDNDIFFKANDFQPNSDSQWVQKVSSSLETKHNNIIIDTQQLTEALTQALKARDLPGMADIDSSLYLFCREVKKNATVALSGECADEIFGGYPWFQRQELLYSDTFPWSQSLEERTSLLSPEIRNRIDPLEYVSERYKQTLGKVPRLEGENKHEERLREIFYLNIVWFMSNLLDRKDRMSMATGLEIRVPFCDHRFVEYVWNIPWHIKNYNGREKGILRKALKGLLPDDVLERKKSPYPRTFNPSYSSAVRKWLSAILNDSTSPIHEIINTKIVRNMIETESEFQKPWFGQLMRSEQLFAYLIQIDIWLKEYKVNFI